MNYWLFKSEPSDYSIDDLKRDKVEPWDGVRNYQVRNMFRDEVQIGDLALFYHSNAGLETGVVGEMEIVSEAKTDQTQFDSKDSHYDPKSPKDNPRWVCPEVGFVSKLARVVTLSEIKQLPEFGDSRLTAKGNRLSVVPLTKAQYQKILQVAKQ
jgi:predicted RNA-binding protein with PUA-like domain